MSQTVTDRFLNTPAKAILSNWSTLKKLLIERATRIKDSKSSEQAADEDTAAENQRFALLSDTVLNDTFCGPYQGFFNLHIHAYAKLTRVRSAVMLRSEDIFKKEQKLAAQVLEVPESIVRDTSLPDLDKLFKQLDEQLPAMYEQWRGLVNQWQSRLIEGLQAVPLALSILELAELQQQEPLSELHDRFVDLSIDPPKTKAAGSDFTSYLTLKTYNIILSALSRQHEPHTADDIQKVLKKLKSVFDSIQKEEKQLLQAQEEQLNALIRPINY